MDGARRPCYPVSVQKRINRQGRGGADRVKNKKRIGLFLLIGALALLFLFLGEKKNPEVIPYPDFWRMAEEGQVLCVLMGDGEYWQAELSDGRQAATPNPRSQDGKERLLQLGIEVREQRDAVPGLALGFAVLAVLVFFASRREKGAAGLQRYAAVQAASEIPQVTFADVAASEDTLRAMGDLVSFLKAPEAFARYGARFPKGVLLYGPPGTGKTLLARALAGEAKTPFFAMSGADFVQVYVGVGASRVRELFRKARKAGRGVIFIDEIDAIGKTRDNANDEREQTLNALLTEMSGFSGADGIIVLAATNRVDTLDPALLREGRFDRRIEVGLPDYEDRLKILAVHARGKPLAKEVSLEALARQTALFSGAQLETLLNEAAIRAARRSAEEIGPLDIEAAYCAVTVGEERPGRMTAEDKRIAAWHEAGHALVTYWTQPDARLARLTVIPSSRGAAGYLMSVPKDRLLHTRSQLMGMLCAALGGRAAEEMLLGRENVTTGAASDLKKAREIASAMAGEFMMGDTGDPEADRRQILDAAFALTRKCLQEHRAALERLADALMDRETLREEEILAILASPAPAQ